MKKRMSVFLLALTAVAFSGLACSVGSLPFIATATPTASLTPTPTATPTPTRTPTATPVPTKIPGIETAIYEYDLSIRFTKAYFTDSYDADLDGNGLKTYHPAKGSLYLIVESVVSGNLSSLTIADPNKNPWLTELWLTNAQGDKFYWGNWFGIGDYNLNWLYVVPDTSTSDLTLNFKDGTTVKIAPLFK